MNLFQPRTFSTDWEIMVIDRLERPVGNDKLDGFAGTLSDEFALPVKTDWNSIEFALGVNISLGQIWERIETVTDRATQLVREFECDLFPAGAHPLHSGPFFAAHIHVGTLHDETTGIRLENKLVQFTPAFAALAANSPIAGEFGGDAKSRRVREQAWGCTQPGSIRNPKTSQNHWGSDAGPKLPGAPTLEVRITDCASSRRFLAELAVFVAAFVHQQGTQDEADALTVQGYHDGLTNRWTAARDGLQATFCWKGGPRPVVEILDEMLDSCAESLAALGARRADLGIINAMLAKRATQADFALSVAARYPDPFLLASALGKLCRHWTVFDEWLAAAPALDPLPALDDDAILAEHLAVIGDDTHFYRSRDAMLYPPPLADALLEQLVESGKVARQVTARGEVLLSRNE